jgi:hypothetical protein
MKYAILIFVLWGCTKTCRYDAQVRLTDHPDKPRPAAAVAVRCDGVPVWSGLCNDATVTVDGDTSTVWCDGRRKGKIRKVTP